MKTCYFIKGRILVLSLHRSSEHCSSFMLSALEKFLFLLPFTRREIKCSLFSYFRPNPTDISAVVRTLGNFASFWKSIHISIAQLFVCSTVSVSVNVQLRTQNLVKYTKKNRHKSYYRLLRPKIILSLSLSLLSLFLFSSVIWTVCVLTLQIIFGLLRISPI